MDTCKYPCLGAIIGDTIGSVYEFNNIKTTDFQPLFGKFAEYTDDSIMTIAVADWIANTNRSQEELEDRMVYWAKHFICPMGGYGGGFRIWLFHPERLRDYKGNLFGDGKRHPYNSWGNGSAMRASACGWTANSLEEALNLGKQSAEITHNHPEGIKGAQAIAAAIYMARHGNSKESIRAYIEQTFGYDLQHTCDEIRPTYDWEASCQGTVPPAFIAFFDSHDFEESIRLAVSLGGDTDTLACITGGIAQAYYKDIPEEIIDEMRTRLPKEFWNVMEKLGQ
ncbi:MAG: ADP-ribosylglycohydrolase family protein [Paludibacteraceae bacterium]|nr:ADP-ribosylglycohydrolase family protein [Paludibacteraceae bacterium]